MWTVKQGIENLSHVKYTLDLTTDKSVASALNSFIFFNNLEFYIHFACKIFLKKSFLQGYFTDSVQTLQDYCFSQYAVQKGRLLTLTYFSKSQRSYMDLFQGVCLFFNVYTLDSSQTLYDYCYGQYIVITRIWLILTQFFQGHRSIFFLESQLNLKLTNEKPLCDF